MSRQLSFGPFTLDLDCRQLQHGVERQPVHLSPKAFELLHTLIAARPRALSKQELHDRLWPSTFVSEATLSSLVAELRDALGERGRDAQFVRTLHGYGYAFSAPADAAGASIASFANWIVCEGKEIPLGDGEHVLGRDDDSRIALRSPAVSRHHARIIINGAAATLEDLDSKNGTTVRGKPLTSPVQLKDGDEIRIGSFVLTFRTVSAKGSTETAAR
jgi:DNA-binding winged helix-turn-helix (wHTH) protein